MNAVKTQKPKRKLNNTKLLQVWLSEDLYNSLDTLATRRNVTLAEAVRQQIAAASSQEQAA